MYGSLNPYVLFLLSYGIKERQNLIYFHMGSLRGGLSPLFLFILPPSLTKGGG
jgi:hypothetical protein